MKSLLSGQGGMSLRNFSIVFSTVFKEAVKTKAYVYITLGLLVLSVLLFASPTILSNFAKDSSEETYKLVNRTSLGLSEQDLAKLDCKQCNDRKSKRRD